MRFRLLRGRRIAALDRRGAAIRQLVAALALALAVPAAIAASEQTPFLRALLWTAPGAEFSVLAEQPRQCSRADAAIDARPETLAAGEALFNSPALLGGQAAKAELSCAACHRNGRANPHFLMPQLSGVPGTADVTNSFFGPRRGNGRFDPVAIPDLAMPGKVSRAPDSSELARFIRDLVVEEFSGTEPSPAMLDALAAYVRTIGACPAEGENSRRLADQLWLIDRALAGARAAGSDAMLRRQLVAATRHQLGLIDERYASMRHAGLRRDLLAASRDLARIGDRNADEAGWRGGLEKWHARFTGRLVPRLRQQEAASRYDHAELRRALGHAASPPH